MPDARGEEKKNKKKEKTRRANEKKKIKIKKKKKKYDCEKNQTGSNNSNLDSIDHVRIYRSLCNSKTIQFPQTVRSGFGEPSTIKNIYANVYIQSKKYIYVTYYVYSKSKSNETKKIYKNLSIQTKTKIKKK